MCYKVTCHSCGKPTWAGCGRHIETALKDVPPEQRCKCREEAQKGGQQQGGRSGASTWVHWHTRNYFSCAPWNKYSTLALYCGGNKNFATFFFWRLAQQEHGRKRTANFKHVKLFSRIGFWTSRGGTTCLAQIFGSSSLETAFITTSTPLRHAQGDSDEEKETSDADQTRPEIITVRLPPRAMRRRVTLSRSKFWKLASHNAPIHLEPRRSGLQNCSLWLAAQVQSWWFVFDFVAKDARVMERHSNNYYSLLYRFHNNRTRSKKLKKSRDEEN